MANLVDSIVPLVRQHWWIAALVSSALCIAAACTKMFEPAVAKKQRSERRKKKELRGLADRICSYTRTLREQFPNAAVVVSERDLAEQLRKQPDSVLTALNLLLTERKVQRTQLA